MLKRLKLQSQITTAFHVLLHSLSFRRQQETSIPNSHSNKNHVISHIFSLLSVYIKQFFNLMPFSSRFMYNYD
jgi:hypothetical protein